MNPNRRAVTLHDVIMGKKGIRYTLSEMITILTHYNITPALQRSRHRRLSLFQQLHILDYDKGGLTRLDRLRILSGHLAPSKGSPAANGNGPDSIEDSEVEEVAELPTPSIKPEKSIIPYMTSCSVCLESYTRRHFPSYRITAECDHEPTICFDCLKQSIDSQIGTRTWDKLICPLCPMNLSFETVKAYSSQESFEKYDRYATMHALRGVSNFCMCLGPGCDSGQIHASGNRQPIMICIVCHFKTCFTHQMPWHEGTTCTEYDRTRRRQNEENEASLTLLRNVGLICPSCSLRGIKVSGCDHMTCPRCSYEYCSRCLASYEEIKRKGNDAHEPSCPYHTSSLPSEAMMHPEGYLDENGNVLPWVDDEDEEDSDEENIVPVVGRIRPAILPPLRQPLRLPLRQPRADPNIHQRFPGHGQQFRPHSLNPFAPNAMEHINRLYGRLPQLQPRRA